MMQLIKKIRDIPEEGQHLEVAFDRSFLGDALNGIDGGMDADLDVSSVRAAFDLLKTGDNVFVRGALGGRLVLPCVRCLGAAELDIEVPLHLTASPEDPDAEELPPEARDDDDVDYFHHDGEVVDLNP